jgi:hypothetical protein
MSKPNQAQPIRSQSSWRKNYHPGGEAQQTLSRPRNPNAFVAARMSYGAIA